ncbi:hypothetical protein [Pseudanabaena sp. 'Roaring Creek']|uniref:hypothetical protein n=1 Tax=Pseudanabaena sp. 'Roaring Creek' TaxID=1681830 RepID=UPI000ACB1D09|nr:hypothetical protein [Pseudanabaena sp. 'Roaring Creek']
MYRKRQKMSVANIGATILAAFVGAIVVPMPTQAQQATVNPENRSVRDEADRLLDRGYDQLKNGKPREAIKTWLYAIGYYRQVNDQAAISYTLARVSDAYEMIGANKAAQDTLIKRIGYGNTLQDKEAIIESANNLTSLTINQSDVEPVAKLNKTTLALSEQNDQGLNTAIALNNKGLIAGRYGDHLAAIKLYYASIKQYPIREPIGEGYVYIHSGDSRMALDDYKSAIADYGNALTLARQHRNYPLMSVASDRLIAAYLEVPNFYRIEELLQNRSSLALVMGDRETAAIIQRYLGDLYLSFGNLPKARLAYQESYDFAAMLEDKSSLPLREAYYKLQALEKM